MAGQTDTRLKIILDAQDNASKRIAELEKQLSKLERAGNRAAASTRRGLGGIFGGREAGGSGRFGKMLDPGALNREAIALAGVNRNAGDAASSVAQLLPRLAGLGAVGMVAGIDRMAASWAAATTAMGRQARMLDMPVAHLTAMGNAAALAGSSADALKGGLGGLQQRMYDARFGRDNQMLSALQAMHIDPNTPVEKAFDAILEKAHDAAGPVQRMTILTRIFGDALGHELFPIADMGVAKFQALIQQAERFGHQTDLDTARAGELTKSWNGLGVAAQQLNDTAMSALSPTLTMLNTELAGGIADIRKGLDGWTQSKGPEWLRDQVKGVLDDIRQLKEAGGHKDADKDHRSWRERLLHMVEDHPWLSGMLGLGAGRMAYGYGRRGLMAGLRLGTGRLGMFAAAAGMGLDLLDPRDASGSWIDRSISGAAAFDDFMARRTGFGRTYDQQHAADPAGFAMPRFGRLNPNAQLGGLIDQYSDRLGIDPAFARALAHAESGGRMVGNKDSSAFGVYQLLDGTAKDLGVDNRDLEGNVKGGLRYYRQALDAVGGDKLAAIAAYHDGLNSEGVKWWRDHPGDDSRFSSAAIQEAGRVGAYATAEDRQMLFGPGGNQEDFSTPQPDDPEQPDPTLGGLRLDPAAQSGGTVTTNTTIHVSHDAPPRVASTSSSIGNVQANKPKVVQSGMARSF